MTQNILRLIVLIFLFSLRELAAQETRQICGQVKDEKGKPLSMAYISLTEPVKTSVTDQEGRFCIEGLTPGVYHLHISFLGYNCIHDCTADVTSGDVWLDLHMQPEVQKLAGVEVSGQRLAVQKALTGIPTEVTGKAELMQHQRGSLVKSLEYIPGFKAMEIGQGLSKPVIRGLGFDRVVVTDQGVKQEGQQWGADHGLEIDPYGVEEAEVVKGLLSLLAGSDAIGGALMLKAPAIPAEGTFSGDFTFAGHSVNDYGAVSLGLKTNRKGWFSHLRASFTDYADYRVPADSFYYNNFRLPIYNRRLKNTAGVEHNISVGTGYISLSSLTRFYFSDYYTRAGFFPGSHGIPTANKLQPDSNARNTELPYQEVFHRKAIVNHVIFRDDFKWSITGGLQDNLRKEWSKFHTHYPNQQAPAVNPDLELELRLRTLSLSTDISPLGDIGWHTGAQVQHQWNQTGGYMFLLAPYRRTLAGLYGLYKGEMEGRLRWSAGIRYDYGYMHIDSVYSVYAQKLKSKEIKNIYHSLTFSLGSEWRISEYTSLFFSLGKGFRLPSAMELSANGIHHGSFRYELGDPNLRPENMYQCDVSLSLNMGPVSFQLSPFVAYSPDFIFLTPTGSYNLPDGTPVSEADAGQVFIYRQNHALRAGGEINLEARLPWTFVARLAGDFVYATDFDYPLPFTPPASVQLNMDKTIQLSKGKIGAGTTIHAVAAQHRVARNEPETPAYITQDINFAWNYNRYSFTLQWLNMWNKKYFNHIAYYRIIELPEAGTNLQLTLNITF